ncbi:MAG: DNA polymerase IV [Clostridia bacterium]|nr:DNA polymerase IV [Clostridia bacterium]
MERVIIHSDMNSCYASIECSLNPELKGKPVAVGGSVEDRHGIILAKTEQAKKCGVKTGEPIYQAKNKCPDLIIVRPHFESYLKYFSLAHEIYARYTDKIEPMGLDEAWCDLTGSIALFGSAEGIADEIRESFKKELGITVSVGISYNKIFAKLGSDIAANDSVYTITREDYKEKVWPLPAGAMMGVGRRTAVKLASYGIRTIGDIASTSPEWLVKVFGVAGREMWIFANGTDTSRVMPDGYCPPVKSIGHGITCTADLVNTDEVWKVFLSLSQDVSKRLRSAALSASAIQIAVKDNRLVTRQFQCDLPYLTQSATEIAEAAVRLFSDNYNWNYDVRAVSVRAINLKDENAPEQLSLYTDYKKHEKRQKIDKTVMELRRRFGDNSVFNCCLLTENKIPGHNKDKIPLPKKMYR